MHYAMCAEMILLLAVALTLLFPLKFVDEIFGLSRESVVDTYYASSLAIIALAQIAYVWPIKSFRIHNYKACLIGTAAFAIALSFWLARIDGRRIDFSQLENGEIWGPMIIAVVIPLIHAMVHLVCSNARLNGALSIEKNHSA